MATDNTSLLDSYYKAAGLPTPGATPPKKEVAPESSVQPAPCNDSPEVATIVKDAQQPNVVAAMAGVGAFLAIVLWTLPMITKGSVVLTVAFTLLVAVGVVMAVWLIYFFGRIAEEGKQRADPSYTPNPSEWYRIGSPTTWKWAPLAALAVIGGLMLGSTGTWMVTLVSALAKPGLKALAVLVIVLLGVAITLVITTFSSADRLKTIGVGVILILIGAFFAWHGLAPHAILFGIAFAATAGTLLALAHNARPEAIAAFIAVFVLVCAYQVQTISSTYAEESHGDPAKTANTCADPQYAKDFPAECK